MNLTTSTKHATPEIELAVEVRRVHVTRLFVTVCTASFSSAAAASMAAPTFAELERCFLDDIPVVCGHTFRSDSRTEATRRRNGDGLQSVTGIKETGLAEGGVVS